MVSHRDLPESQWEMMANLKMDDARVKEVWTDEHGVVHIELVYDKEKS